MTMIWSILCGWFILVKSIVAVFLNLLFLHKPKSKNMKKALLIIIFTIASVYFFSSCERESSSDVNQDRIYALYEVVYNQTQDISYARASFFFGSITGTKLELADPSYVKFNDTPLGFKEALAYRITSYNVCYTKLLRSRVYMVRIQYRDQTLSQFYGLFV